MKNSLKLCGYLFSVTMLTALLQSPIVSADSVTLVGAGDIAGCESEKDLETSRLLDSIPGTVFTTGDHAYPDGTAEEFADCYDPTWGRHKSRTRPAPGNHDYHIPGATAYYDYFGAAAGDPAKGYYSYDSGDWHIVVLNSECSDIGGCSVDSAQGLWLQADLEANPTACTLAYWHKPRFSSNDNHGSNTKFRDLWRILYDADADVVLNGHAHIYERFAPQDPDGVADPARGIRQFIVGTGGRRISGFTTPEPNSEVREDNTNGVLKLTLNANSYDWEFVPIAGQTFTDSGSASCVSDQAEGPSVVRSSPADGSTFAVGDDIAFAATASDAQQADLTADLVWTSDIDGIINVGGSFTTTLSQGTHLITATVTDSQGINASSDFNVTVTAVGNTSPGVTITTPANGSVLTTDDGIEFAGTAIDPEDGDISTSLTWVSDQDGDLGVGAPVSALSAGTHVITASVTDSGDLEGSATIDITVLPSETSGTVLDVSVNSSLDDAEERANGSIYLNSSDLELVDDSGDRLQEVGIRFSGILIPQDATVIDAYLQFTVDEPSAGEAALIINGEASDDAAAFSETRYDISSRPTTAAAVDWSPVDWNSVGVAGPDQRTPNLKTVIQEIVSRPGWNPGNAIALVISGSGTRGADSYDGDSTAAPRLLIVYGQQNIPPAVDAGVDRSVELIDDVQLQGSVTDDELPNPPRGQKCYLESDQRTRGCGIRQPRQRNHECLVSAGGYLCPAVDRG